MDPLSRPRPPATRLPYRVRALGRVERRPYHSTRGTYHDDAMLTIVMSCRGTYLRGGHRLEVIGPSVGIVLPSSDKGLLMSDPARPYDHFFCRFAGDHAKRAARRIAHRYGATAADPGFEPPRWAPAAVPMRRALADPPGTAIPADRMSRVDAALAEALAILDEPDAVPGPAIDGGVLRRYVHDHVANPVDLGRAADDLGVSRGHLCRLARQHLGTTFHAAWTRAKLDWAGVLLAEPTLSVADVAARVGFRDAAYFAKVFGRHVGQRPAAYRRVHCGLP